MLSAACSKTQTLFTYFHKQVFIKHIYPFFPIFSKPEICNAFFWANIKIIQIKRFRDKSKVTVHSAKKKGFHYKRFHARGRIRGVRAPLLAEIPTFFMISEDHWIKKRGKYFTAKKGRGIWKSHTVIHKISP